MMHAQVWELPDYSFVRKQILAAPRQRRLPLQGRGSKRPRYQCPETPTGKKARLWSPPKSKDLGAEAACSISPLRAEE